MDMYYEDFDIPKRRGLPIFNKRFRKKKRTPKVVRMEIPIKDLEQTCNNIRGSLQQEWRVNENS